MLEKRSWQDWHSHDRSLPLCGANRIPLSVNQHERQTFLLGSASAEQNVSRLRGDYAHLFWS